LSHCCGSTSNTPTRAGRRDWIFATRSAGRTGARCSAPRSASCAHAGPGLLGYVEQDGKSSAGVGRHGRRCRLRDAPVRSRGGEPCRQAPGGGLRFHDLHHSYGTWLVDDGVPVNTLQRVIRLRALDDDEDPDDGAPVPSGAWVDAGALSGAFYGPSGGGRLPRTRRRPPVRTGQGAFMSGGRYWD
jgi:hypothetical protein